MCSLFMICTMEILDSAIHEAKRENTLFLTVQIMEMVTDKRQRNNTITMSVHEIFK